MPECAIPCAAPGRVRPVHDACGATDCARQGACTGRSHRRLPVTLRRAAWRQLGTPSAPRAAQRAPLPTCSCLLTLMLACSDRGARPQRVEELARARCHLSCRLSKASTSTADGRPRPLTFRTYWRAAPESRRWSWAGGSYRARECCDTWTYRRAQGGLVHATCRGQRGPHDPLSGRLRLRKVWQHLPESRASLVSPNPPMILSPSLAEDRWWARSTWSRRAREVRSGR